QARRSRAGRSDCRARSPCPAVDAQAADRRRADPPRRARARPRHAGPPPVRSRRDRRGAHARRGAREPPRTGARGGGAADSARAGRGDERGRRRGTAPRADELGADPERIAVGGDSAGGHLAAVTSLLSAADGGPAPAFQLLVYPVTDCAEVHASRRTFAEGFYLTKEKMDWYEAHFLAA